ncbi:MAG: insulinase family protein [Alphaproteobacteria bacterium]|nr:insulinase family protein [Alphaproteobacteria bacterium]
MTSRLTTLNNGIRVVTHHMPAVETASVGVWVGAGTRNETAEVNGVAHLLEHMAFKGTETRSATDIAEQIEAVGGHLNAYTGRESTVYYAKVLKEDVDLALDLVADILQNATFDEEELRRECAVVLQEIGQAHDTPDDLIFDYFQSVAFPDQALGRPVLGCPKVVSGMSRGAITDYMHNAYSSDRMVLAAAGRVDHDALVERAQALFGGRSSNGGIVCERAQYAGGDYRDARDLEQLHLVLGFAGVPYDDEDFYAATALTTLLGGGMSSRLFQEIRERRGLVYSIYSFASYYADSGLFGIYAGTGAGEAAELVEAICKEIRRLPGSLRETEICRTRNQLKAGTLMSLESTGSRCDQLGQQTLVFGAPIPIEEQVRRIEAVDSEAIMRVASRIFTGTPTVAAVGPSEKLPAFSDIASMLAG